MPPCSHVLPAARIWDVVVVGRWWWDGVVGWWVRACAGRRIAAHPSIPSLAWATRPVLE